MSLSQKHSGKVFVPWYNTSEWRQVYDVLCSKNVTNYNQVLDILKTWKYRMPLLSAGVEGTRILLEAILIENHGLSDTQLIQIYALSLMRFLNICAANSDKQGTFHKTAVKNELPKWLINIRHDIAHNHKLPSKSILELGLNCCLEWVKVKYWEVQKDIILDYVVQENEKFPRIVELLNVYIKLKLDLFFHKDITKYDENIICQINRLVTKKCIKKKIDVKQVISILEESLKQSLADPSHKNIGEQVSKILVNNTLLNTQTNVNSEGTETIPTHFRDIWCNLINILYENGFLFTLLNEILEVTNNIMLDNNIRNVASLWIREIFQGLQKIRMVKEEIDSIVMNSADQLDPKTSVIVLKSIIDKKYPQFKGCFEFHSPHCLSFAGAEVFQEKVLNFPNDYTLNFLESVLKFNKNTEDYINDTLSLVKKLIWSSVNISDIDETYTTEHLKEILGNNVEMEWTDSDKTLVADVNSAANNVESTNKWTLIKDTSSYQGCPLGILPHQNRNINPVLSF